MKNISPALFHKLYTALSSCGPFASDSALRAVFTDARIGAWRNKLPEASNPDERVKVTIDFLRNQYTATQENALVLFVHILKEQTEPNDACYQSLADLAAELTPALAYSPADSPTSSQTQARTPRLPLASLRAKRGWLYGLGGVGVLIVIIVVISSIRSPGTTPLPTASPTLRATSLPSPTLPATVTPSPTLSPTPMSSPTLTASATLTPSIPTSAAAGLYNVSIAQFDQVGATSVEIARRLERDLLETLRQYELTDKVNVEFYPQIIKSGQDAEDLLASTDVLIYGWYDDLGIGINVILGEATQRDVAYSVGLHELPLGTTDKIEELTFVVRDVLPANTTFLSLFVIGHLYYLSNNYAEGYRTFDAAMDSIPETVALENEALLHFFNARRMHASSGDDFSHTDVVCEYLRAIDDDPSMFEAYNNLAVFLMDDLLRYSPASIEPECGFEIPVASLQPRDLINQALQIHPDWALAHYNLAAFDWKQIVSNYDLDPVEFIPTSKASFEKVLALDNSVAGAHVALGNLAMYEETFEPAVQHFSSAREFWPDSPEVAFNLGQALTLAGQEEEAVDAYQQALSLASKRGDVCQATHLALGNLYHRRMDLESAYREYNLIASDPLCLNESVSERKPKLDEALSLALVKYEIDTGNWVSATQRLESSNTRYFSRYVLWLIYRIQNDVKVDGIYLDLYLSLFSDWSGGDINGLTWADLFRQCVTANDDATYDATTWGSETNPCLPGDLEARLEAAYAKFQYRVHHYLFFNDQWLPGGRGACPYVFTFDEQRQDWLFDTTIIYMLVGPDAEQLQMRPLQRFDGRLWLRELEPETSYIDQVYVRIVTSDGYMSILRPSNAPKLLASDDAYLIMDSGDQYVLNFEFPYDTVSIEKAWIGAEGYYVPHTKDMDATKE